MIQAKKIFPIKGENSPHNSFKIVFLSEGYLPSEKSVFYSACIEFVDKMLKTPPFNLSKINPNWLSVYACFVPSSNSGPSINTAPSTGRSTFESRLNTSTGLLTFNNTLVTTQINSISINHKGEIYLLSELSIIDGFSLGDTGTLICILLPEISGSTLGGEMENYPDQSNYHFISTTKNGEWHQLILRCLGKLLGLGDEFELPGGDHLAPATFADAPSYPNLQYYEQQPTIENRGNKWYSLLSNQELALPLRVFPKTGNTSTPDNSINTTPMTPNSIELWEGGGGYRTKVYRSAKDCLMRRMVGSPTLPVKQQKVPFCFVCSIVLKNKIF